MKNLPAAFTILLLVTFSSCASAPKPPVDPYDYLTLSGDIDGSDKFIFTPDRVEWVHLHWSAPVNMKFQGKTWTDLNKTPDKWNAFANLDLKHATIVRRKGRDVIALEATSAGFVLYLDDSPNGAASYSVTIAIPWLPKK